MVSIKFSTYIFKEHLDSIEILHGVSGQNIMFYYKLHPPYTRHQQAAPPVHYNTSC